MPFNNENRRKNKNKNHRAPSAPADQTPGVGEPPIAAAQSNSPPIRDSPTSTSLLSGDPDGNSGSVFLPSPRSASPPVPSEMSRIEIMLNYLGNAMDDIVET